MKSIQQGEVWDLKTQAKGLLSPYSEDIKHATAQNINSPKTSSSFEDQIFVREVLVAAVEFTLDAPQIDFAINQTDYNIAPVKKSSLAEKKFPVISRLRRLCL